MQRRTLWEAIDSDRSRWWYYGAYVLIAVVFVGGIVFLVVDTGGGRGSGRLIGNSLGLVLPGVLLPLLRWKAGKSALERHGAFKVPPGMFPDTRSVVHDVSLMVGMPTPPDLYLLGSPTLNAFVRQERGRLKIAVTNLFTELPVEEQRAGVAMLFGRNDIPVDSLILGTKHGLPRERENPFAPVDLDDPSVRAKVADTWTKVAAAGDREALRLLREPGPMLTLLKRLAEMDSCLEGIPALASFGCLAWPHGGEQAIRQTDPSLPPEAAAALAAFVDSRGQRGVSPERQRLDQLRQVLPAAEQLVGDPVPLVPGTGRRMAAGTSAPGDAAGRTERRPAMQGRKLARSCPKCGANNVPTNARCIACGVALPTAS